MINGSQVVSHPIIEIVKALQIAVDHENLISPESYEGCTS
jgi:hypothetical protein